MPWKETCAMDERVMFIADYLRDELSVAELCRRYEISRKTGYKWLERYDDEGIVGLKERSHAPHDCPHRMSEAVAEAVVGVRTSHPSWGPRKVRAWLLDHRPLGYWPAASTMGELFVACEEIDAGNWCLRYGPIELGSIDHRSRLVRSRRLRGAGQGTHGRPSGQNVLPILPV